MLESGHRHHSWSTGGESTLAILLSDHPNVESVVEQVFEEEIKDEFSNIDLVATTKDGRTVYALRQDLWLGTSQQDRLQIVYGGQSSKGGLFNNHDVCYLCWMILTQS